MVSFLARYQSGEYEQVWTELLAMGGLVQRSAPFISESFFYADALEVARETMRRARYNIELLVARLPESGYQFGYSWLEQLAQEDERQARKYLSEDDDLLTPEILEGRRQYRSRLLREAEELRKEASMPARPFAPPPPAVERHLRELDQLVGPIPLSVRAWYEVVGEVNFVGTRPQEWIFPNSELVSQTQGEPTHPLVSSGSVPMNPFPGGETALPVYDPLDVAPIEGALDYIQGHLRQHQHVPSFLYIAPDAYGKYSISGGGPYGIAVPNGAIDGELEGEQHQTTFVNYLRICFRWAGLPGCAYFATERGQEELHHLTEGLLPL